LTEGSTWRDWSWTSSYIWLTNKSCPRQWLVVQENSPAFFSFCAEKKICERRAGVLFFTR
jgi:excinuclease UvrABC ATPase subunit